MARAKFSLPSRVTTVTGKLEVAGGQSGEFVIRDNKTHKLFLLSDGDRVKGHNWSATVKLTYHGPDKLNGQIGTLITLPGKDEWNYERHIFLWRLPVERKDLNNWLKAYLASFDVTVTFKARPLEERQSPYLSGRLDPHHEQGMEGNIGWSVFDTQLRGYAGLHPLEEGDQLTIFEKNGRKVLWQGNITPRRLENLRRWCYEPKENASEETRFLVKCFFEQLPAVIKRVNPDKYKNQ